MDNKEVISLVSSYNQDKVKTVPIKYNDTDGNEYKLEAPIFKGGNAEEFLYFMREYQDLCDKVPYSTRDSKAKALESLFKGTELTTWKKCVRTIRPGSNTDLTFSQRLLQFKKTYIPQRKALDNQKDYTRKIKKNDSLE